MKNRVVYIILMCSFVGLFASLHNVDEAEIVPSNVEEEVQRIVNEVDIPSLHACVVSDDELNWVRGFGAQTGPDTVFLIGSIQKVLVAVSILQLYDHGEIYLDDDVNDYLDFSVRNPDYPNVSVTFRMLLSHRSGMNYEMPYEFCFDWDGLFYPDYSKGYNSAVIGIPLEDYLSGCLVPGGAYYSANNWQFEPGTEYRYSNLGYKLLMHLLETVSNRTIAEYMQENIFDPLQMSNTGFNASHYNGHHATPHTRINGTNIELSVWNGRYMMRSTVSDLGHLQIALMNGGLIDDFQLLQSDTIEMMFERTHDTGTYLGPDLRWEGYCLGLDAYSQGLLGHGGSTVGFRCHSYFSPENKIGLIILSNVNGILDSRYEDYKVLESNLCEIRDLIMTDVGMISSTAPINLLLLFSTISIVVIVVSWNIYRYKKKAK
jgi:CubicO group peptidase (beta-lactamase class C family)